MSIAVGVLAFLGVVLFLYLVPVGLWIAAWSSGQAVFTGLRENCTNPTLHLIEGALSLAFV